MASRSRRKRCVGRRLINGMTKVQKTSNQQRRDDAIVQVALRVEGMECETEICAADWEVAGWATG